ncbi:Endogenous retrovirus group K member 18 Pol protein [Lonchura striata]|uniref:ribonuclease H n=1 Tax=Lonchura striata TaxID=40157 RepID=A0A218V9T4_9PASE|nr:Endogenous retrovirus group K member 18 Pol protein [Lonchura striata domestica]
MWGPVFRRWTPRQRILGSSGPEDFVLVAVSYPRWEQTRVLVGGAPGGRIRQLQTAPLESAPPRRLHRAMEAQVPDERLREGMLATVAKQNANEACRQAILSLPLEPEPTLQNMLALTEALYLKDDDWHFITVDTRDPGTWRNIRTLRELVKEQLAKGNIQETTSPWNSPVFVLKKPGKDEWRLLHDLRAINNVIEDMGPLQPGMPSPTMLPENWELAVIDIKNCFFQIPLHPDDAPRFAFSVPSINREAPMERYHWKVLPQGMKNSPSICQWYVSSLLSPVRAATEGVIIQHYMDDILICAPNGDLLTHALELTTNALVAVGFELREDKIQKMPPWKYLGLEINKRTIVPQKLAIRNSIRNLADVQQLCGSLNWVRPWLGINNEDLAPLFDLLKGGDEPSSPRELTPEAKAALQRVQEAMSARQAHRCDPGLPFKFIILGRLPHLHGVIFQWTDTLGKGKDHDKRDPLSIIEWVFLSHSRSKRMTQPQELVAELIRKARMRIRELAGCDFECIHIPLQLESGHFTKAMLEHLLQSNESLQFALDSYTGKISVLRPAHKIFNSDVQFALSTKQIQSKKPLKALTVFTDASGGSHKSVVTWKDPQTQRWEADVVEVEGSPQVAELAAVVRAFERFSEPFNLVTDSAYVAGVVSRAQDAILQGVSNDALNRLLSKLIKLVSHREQPFYVMHIRSHTDLPGFLAEAKISHQLYHQNAPGLVRQFHLTRDQAKAIVATCPSYWDENCNDEVTHWAKAKSVATIAFLPWIGIAQAFNELAGLECWVAKQANLTSAALSNLLADEEVTRQATLQNRAAIDFLLLLHNHKCEEFAGLCCMNLSSRAEDVRTSISKMQDMIHHLKKETAGWLDSLLEGWGLSGWIKSIMQTGLMLLLGLVALVIGFGVIKRLLIKAINTTVSVNHATLAEPHELDPLNAAEPKEENLSDRESVWFEDETMNYNSPV